MANVRRSPPCAAALGAIALAAAVGGCAGRSATAPAPATAPPTPTPTAPSAAATAPATAPPSGAAAAATAAPPDGALAQAPAPTKTAVLPRDGSFAAIHAGLEDATSEDCLGCHAELQPRLAVHGSHPVGLDLAAASAAAPGRYRPLQAVRGAGLALPGGKVACVTCHDLGSPWKHRIALPAGAPARPAVVLGDPSTYGDDEGTGEGAPAAALAPGAAISSKPLCQSCHRL
jgi:hypothetical protein